MKKNDYQKLGVLGIILMALLIFQEYTGREKTDFSGVTFISKNTIPVKLSEFDPNDLDVKQWQQLGFSASQAAVILNYKKVVGGSFTSRQQLKKCFAISEDQFSQLEKYILLPETGSETYNSYRKAEKRTLSVSGAFNPDRLSHQDWQAMGFSEKQAAAIVKYKHYLGGSFISKEKFRECFIISDENYKKLAPYIILPEKAPALAKTFINQKAASRYFTFDPNAASADDWKRLGFSEKQAQTIVSYRDKILKGQFKNIEDLKQCFVISPEKFEELKPYIRLSTVAVDSKDKMASKIPQQEKTDFSKTDLNTITFRQLMEFGLDERSAGSFIGFRKKLGGFMNKQQIMQTYNIDRDLVQKLIDTAPLNTSEVPRYTLAEAPEEWLKNHPYFKYSADKIIFYRISEPNEKKIWKFLKLKPEYEERMKWYLK
ncbi:MULTISPECIES: helix-hairpin-helix domain-containing protein [Chryseobacterium]|uniref:DNA uptake protein ComE-like DNA-binding protein n=1 Tax=Chryseobacterium camelliae TaxID=1265445 RepID=A0ABU0TEK6_9FLAO|nr:MULTISPECIES: helix-hairpin-helix domain-containing protein [Chryseobacterium]MDT3406698.1 DNA uptake protein ComE-like DNA-binding protein [Pseudacidovorax intermedius]MDQ1095505.1 DNA uptake protein ComE-like DNA-binding protein [Chryseobacterium camelliae]MDQ1099442.1 DNA uptake protein ComE-like DNA-binding protein [Chryseobacterium sp. SORGH_AS_1048]MDR6086788.1 DNA uptake protein ComE-like DNA-binding protein [Chryseobacterium sp. SORGH_AS_0909]MDR6131161.1 DNA uptake protein ComE-lik